MGAFECVFFFSWLFVFEAYKRIITVSRVCSTNIRQTKVIQNDVSKQEITIVLIKAMFILYRMAFTPVRKPYRIWLLFTHTNDDFGALSCVAPISEVEKCPYSSE